MKNEVDKTINNPFEQELIDNGYKIFNDTWKHAIRGFQKRFRDEKGTKYFITMYHYNHKKQNPEWQNIPPYDSYTFEVQFKINKDGKDPCIDISYSADMLPNEYRPVTTLKEVEDFFEKFFITFNADYYETD